MRTLNLITLIAFILCGLFFGAALSLSAWKGPNSFTAVVLPWSLFVGWVLVLLSAVLFLIGLVLAATGKIKSFWREYYAVNLGLAVVAIALLEANLTHIWPLAVAIVAALVVSAAFVWSTRVPEVALAVAAVVAVGLVMLIPAVAVPVVRLGVGAFLVALPLLLLAKERTSSA